MSNPEYENKVSPTELYNDEIIQQFEAIRQVIHKEILPSTYNELIITSNQSGTLSNYMDIKSYPQSEIIFPLSPQSGNINWLSKNYLRFHFTFEETISSGQNSIFAQEIPFSLNHSKPYEVEYETAAVGEIGPIDGASIFKSIELNYAGTSIWTSAYQQVEAFATYSSLPTQISQHSIQWWSLNKNYDEYPYKAFLTNIKNYHNVSSSTTLNFDFYLDIDISRLSPILSWLSLIPSFCNKLTLRVVIDAPYNWLVRRLYYDNKYPEYFGSSLTGHNWSYVSSDKSSYIPICTSSESSTIKWRCDLCEIHQNNATMTEDTRIRLISLIQQLGGKWIYPIRYWNTAIAPIQTISSSSSGNINLQFVLTGCYFRALTFCAKPQFTTYSGGIAPAFTDICSSPGNGLFYFPFGSTNFEIYCDSELLVSYTKMVNMLQDTNGALMDEDKYSISYEIVQSIITSDLASLNCGRQAFTISTGPPNGLYSGKYTSEKMGTHNILLKFKPSAFDDSTGEVGMENDYNLFAWCCALQDGVIVFDNFNGSYFNTARRMQQVYEALT